MLGRFKHEGANIQIADSGHAVAYMGDDERGDYLYKFVSADRFDPRDSQGAHKRNLQLLTRGTLYVARLTGDGAADGQYDGTGEWIPLTSDTTSYVAGMSVADVLIDTRLAADKVDADPDGPARGRPAEPGQRPDLRGAHQQLQPRVDVPGRRAEPGRARARCGPRSARR